MINLTRTVGWLIALSLVLAACVPPNQAVAPLSTPAAQSEPKSLPTPVVNAPIISAEDQAGAQLIVAFINAFNRGDFALTQTLLDEQVIVSDCDFRAQQSISLRGKNAALDWLRQRIADHDQVVVSEILGGYRNHPSPDTFGATFVHRSSDTLRSLGFPKGISWDVHAKLILSLTPPRRLLGLVWASSDNLVCRTRETG